VGSLEAKIASQLYRDPTMPEALELALSGEGTMSQDDLMRLAFERIIALEQVVLGLAHEIDKRR
jgi:hypothetical protein